MQETPAKFEEICESIFEKTVYALTLFPTQLGKFDIFITVLIKFFAVAKK